MNMVSYIQMNFQGQRKDLNNSINDILLFNQKELPKKPNKGKFQKEIKANIIL